MKDRILKIVSRVLQISVDENTTQGTCSAWDSLHHLNLIIELETEFDVSFEPEEMAVMKSIAAIEEMIKAKL